MRRCFAGRRLSDFVIGLAAGGCWGESQGESEFVFFQFLMLSGVKVDWWEMLLVSGFNVAVFDDDELPDKDKDGVLVKLGERKWG